MYRLLLTLVFAMIYIISSYSQSFSGVLTYKYVTDDYSNADIYEMSDEEFELYGNNTTEEFVINNDSLYSKEYTSDGIYMEKGIYQDSIEAYIYNYKHTIFVDFEKLHKNGIKYELIKKN